MDMKKSLVAVASLQEHILEQTQQDAQRFHEFISTHDTCNYLDNYVRSDEFPENSNLIPVEYYTVEYLDDVELAEKSYGILYVCETHHYDTTEKYHFTVPYEYFGNADAWERNFLDLLERNRKNSLTVLYSIFPSLEERIEQEEYDIETETIYDMPTEYFNPPYYAYSNVWDSGTGRNILDPEYIMYSFIEDDEGAKYIYNGVEYFAGDDPVTLLYKIDSKEIFAYKGFFGNMTPLIDGKALTKPLTVEEYYNGEKS